MTVRFPLVLVNGYSQEIASTDRIANGGNIVRGSSQPSTAVDGDLWYDTSAASLNIYDGTAWTSVTGASSGSQALVSPSAPSTPANGELWYDTTNNELKIYIAASVQWVPAQLNFFVQNTAPSSGFYEGDIWFNPSSNLFSMYIAGATGAWVQMGSQTSISDILAFG